MHGFCGIWGCIAIAFFAKDIGIFYGHKDSGKLLGYQIAGVLCIAVWSGGLSAIFFLAAKHMGVLRLEEKDELIGGDLHYFGPIELDTSLANVDLRTGVAQAITASAKRAQENEMAEGGSFATGKKEVEMVAKTA